MAQEVKNEFKIFVRDEVMPDILNTTGYNEDELMEKEVELEELDEPEMFNGEVMNNYQLVINGEYRFDCFLDQELIDELENKEDLRFKDLL
jgi:hypothetical protein